MTTILVTGGAGFIGSCFIRRMLNEHPDYKIINLDALTYCGNIENLDDVKNNPNYTFVHGNICDRKLVRDIISNICRNKCSGYFEFITGFKRTRC